MHREKCFCSLMLNIFPLNLTAESNNQGNSHPRLTQLSLLMEKRQNHDEKKVMDNPGAPALTSASSNDRQHSRIM